MDASLTTQHVVPSYIIIQENIRIVFHVVSISHRFQSVDVHKAFGINL